MEYSDESALLKRLKEDDTEAYLALYQRYHLLIYQWTLKLVKIPELAEDLVQEVFLKVWQIRARLDPQQSFPAFVYRIARNKAFTMLKKIAADEKLLTQVFTQISETAEGAENKLQWQQYEKLLAQAVEQLPQQRQKVFKLCRQQGKSYEEVGVELGISRNTVKEHMVMAVKNIREYFYRYGDISLLLLVLFDKKF